MENYISLVLLTGPVNVYNADTDLEGISFAYTLVVIIRFLITSSLAEFIHKNMRYQASRLNTMSSINDKQRKHD